MWKRTHKDFKQLEPQVLFLALCRLFVCYVICQLCSPLPLWVDFFNLNLFSSSKNCSDTS